MSATPSMLNNAALVFEALKQASHLVLFGVRYEVCADQLPKPAAFDIADLQFNDCIQYRSEPNRLGEQSYFSMSYARAMNAVDDRVLTFFNGEQHLPVKLSWQ